MEILSKDIWKLQPVAQRGLSMRCEVERPLKRNNGWRYGSYQEKKKKGKELRATLGTLKKSHLFGGGTQSQQRKNEEIFQKEKGSHT